MPSIVDIIEDYIKARLNQSTGGIIVLRRSELAEKFQCVPSQINYVLSTRFTSHRGYIIETRRGGGGFVRIIKIPLQKAENLIDVIYEKVGEKISTKEAINMIRYLAEEEVVTKREGYIMENALEAAVPNDTDEDDQNRALILKSMIMVILRHQK